MFFPKMQNSKSRSGSSELLPKGTLSSPKSMQASKFIRGLNSPTESLSDSKAAMVFDKKPITKSSSLTEMQRRIGRGSEIQPQLYQLQEELRKTRDERTRALEDLEELRSNKRMSMLSNKEEVDVLEKKVEKAKESERKMLESLISQTKQLEQSKMLLEEARLEIRSLQENIKSLEENSSCNGRENGERSFELVRAHEEIVGLRNELKLATQAEEKSKEAMDELAIALKEVSTEANQMKTRLSMMQSELHKAKLEAEQSKSLLMMTDDKLRAAVEESERLKMESEDLVAICKEKEDGFMRYTKVSEEENSKLKLENNKLIESLRGSREETSKLRDILKQAVNEATVVKEALEIARNENSQLKDSLSEKVSSLQSIKQEYECLKVSEAAATDSVKELKGFLAATSSMDSTSKTSIGEVSESKKITKIESDRFLRGDARIPQAPHARRHSVGEFGKYKGSTLAVDGQSMDRENLLFPSLSNVSDSRVPSSIFSEDRETFNAIDFVQIGGSQSNGSPMRQKKKKPMLKRFGEMLRKKSFHK